ncbi:MAG: aminotransferase class III-fold pyridoxal phosphate-dependent enzyme [Candidatus Margulisiibacteriota bacterium]
MKPADIPKVRTRYRKIMTKLPAPGSLHVFAELEKYESRSMHGQIPVVWDRALDFQVFDPYGNCWIDFTSTIFVANSGHSNPSIVKAIKNMLDQGLLHTYTFASRIRAQFLKKLIEFTPRQFEKAFLLSAGTEATECCLKLIRMHGQTVSSNKMTVISFQGSMHGRTMAAELLKGNPKTSAWIGRKDPNILQLPFPYIWTKRGGKPGKKYDWARHFKQDIDALARKGLDFKNIAGFIIESYLGWGAIFYPKEYIKALVSFAKKHNAIVAFDEIQGGAGRTGKLFVYQHYGVEPDMICLGKGISGSLPLSAVLGSKKIMDLPDIGSMSSTHSANPLCCAAALANIESITSKKLVKEAKRKGKILKGRLLGLQKKYGDRISYVFGEGLVAAVLLKDPKTGNPDAMLGNKICEKAMQKGLLLVHTGRESIKIGPPLTIPDAALKEGLDVLEECFDEAIAEAQIL